MQRLAVAVRSRRDELGLTQAEVVARGGLSLASLQAVEAGQRASLQNKTMHGLEQGLLWTAGSVRAVLSGGDPQSLETAALRATDLEALDLNPERWTAKSVVDTLGAILRREGEAAAFEALYNLADVHRKVTGQDTSCAPSANAR